MKRFRMPLVIASICGLPLMIIGLYFMYQARNVEDIISVESGNLKVVEAPTDSLFGVSADNPLIIRKVEMYQYCFVPENESSSYDSDGRPIYREYVEERFSEHEYGTESAYDNPDFKGTKQKYVNPKFPEGLESEWLYGETEIGENGVRLSEHLIAKFKTGRCMIKIPKESLPKDGGNKYELTLISDGTYTNGEEDNPQIGDIRVTFTMADPEVAAKGFTAVGKLAEKDGHQYIGEDFEGLLLTSAELSKEEALEKYSERSEDDGSVFLGLGIGLFVIAFLFSVGFLALTGQFKRQGD